METDRRGKNVKEQKENEDPSIKSAKTSAEKVRALRAKMRRTSRRRDVLAFSSRPGFKRRIINDQDGRLQSFLNDGWTLVRSDETGGEQTALDPVTSGTATSKVVQTTSDGPLRGYLIEIPEEIYLEDKGEKQRKITESEQAMLAGLSKKFEHNKTKFD